jgi:hypothetical protein
MAATVELSASMLDEAEPARVELTAPPRPMAFDAQGRLR